MKKSDNNNRDIEFVDDYTRARMIEDKPRYRRAINLIMLLLVISLIWSSTAYLDEITRAEGKVIPISKTQVIQYYEGGILAEIMVKEGDIVDPDQVLLRVDDTRFSSDHNENRIKYLVLLGSISRLRAELDNKKNVEFPDILHKEGPEIIQREKKQFNLNRDQLQSKIKTHQKTYDLAKKEMNLIEPLVKKGLMSELELIRITRQVSELEGKIDEIMDEYNTEAQSQLMQQESLLASLNAALFAIKDRMLRTTIKSPVYGKITKINLNTINSVIQPGEDIIEILPLDDQLLIEARIKPADIAFLHAGQSVTIRVTAYDFSIYGSLQGEVSYISGDTIQEIIDGRPQDFYRVMIETEKSYLEKNGKRLPILPGMLVSVDILTGEKTVLTYLLKPIIKAQGKALTER